MRCLRMKYNKKGQAALEFLTTYGWAFLIILVMIGALAYFGVLDPSQFISQRCQVSAPFSCDGQNYVVKATAPEVQLRIRNGLNTELNITNITVKSDSDSTYYACSTLSVLPQVVKIDGGVSDINCTINTTATRLTEGKKKRIQFKIFYSQTDGSGYTQVTNGEIFANTLS